MLESVELVRARPATTTSASCPCRPTQQRLVGGTSRNSVSADLRQGHVGRHALGGLPGGRRAPAQPPRHHHRTAADFSIATQESILSAATSVDHTMTVHARRHRRDLAARRRDRRHEHHARLGHRADPRDRAAQGARRRPRLIRRQFLVEASLLGLAGGLLGVGFGIVGAIVLPRLADTRVDLSLALRCSPSPSPSGSVCCSACTPLPGRLGSPPSTPCGPNDMTTLPSPTSAPLPTTRFPDASTEAAVASPRRHLPRRRRPGRRRDRRLQGSPRRPGRLPHGGSDDPGPGPTPHQRGLRRARRSRRRWRSPSPGRCPAWPCRSARP